MLVGGVPKGYRLAGGVPDWQARFAPAWEGSLPMALGARAPGADPGPPHGEAQYVPKLKLGSAATIKKGGCG